MVLLIYNIGAFIGYDSFVEYQSDYSLCIALGTCVFADEDVP